MREQIDRLYTLADEGRVDEVEELADDIEDDIDQVLDSMDEIENSFQQYDESIREEVGTWMEDLRDLEDEFEGQGVHLDVDYDSFIGGDVFVDMDVEEQRGLLDGLGGAGIGAWAYNRGKRGIQKLRNAYRGARNREPEDPDDRIDVNRRRFLAEIAGVVAVGAADYSNAWVDDESCGEEWVRFFEEPSGDVDGFGYGTGQEQCPQPVEGGDGQQPDGNGGDGTPSPTTTPEDQVLPDTYGIDLDGDGKDDVTAVEVKDVGGLEDLNSNYDTPIDEMLSENSADAKDVYIGKDNRVYVRNPEKNEYDRTAQIPGIWEDAARDGLLDGDKE